MADDTLSSIIAAEQQIREALDRERQKADDWLETTRAQIEDDHRQARKAAATAAKEHLQQAEAEARQEVDALLQQAEDKGAQAPADEALRPRVRRLLSQLDPRSDHDRPHGEG